jgi:phosphomannomutase
MNSPIKFGTDGWRAVIAEDYTFENVRACAQATADQINGSAAAARGMVVGYDRRFASEDFAGAVAEVLAGNGVKVYLATEAVPTPVVSYGVTELGTAGAVVITASHNPAQWNGYKVKDADGSSAPETLTSGIESGAAAVLTGGRPVKRLPLTEARAKGLVLDTDLNTGYHAQIRRLVDLDNLKLAKIKSVIDPMYGVGAGHFSELLAGGKIELIEVRGEHNPAFPGMVRPEPIALNLAALTEAVKEHGAGVGIATDGDADRVGVVDENGVFLTQLQTYALLALYFIEARGERGALVKTITQTAMVDRLGEIYGVPVHETPVGFKHVAPLMVSQNAVMGGEESGGYGFRGHVPERDGILAGLYFLDFMVRTGKTPSELLKHLYDLVGPHHYQRFDLTFPAEAREAILKRVGAAQPDTLDGTAVSNYDTRDGFYYTLADGSWLLIRFSGTEPVLRIYAEAENQARVTRLLELGRGITGQD